MFSISEPLHCPFERQTFNELYARYGIRYIIRNFNSFFHTTPLSAIVHWHINLKAQEV